MSADPKAPKVGDVFRGTRYGYKAEVRFVDDDGTVLYRYPNPPPTSIKSGALSREEFAGSFEAVPEPLIAEPVILRPVYDRYGVHWHGTIASGAPSIVIVPEAAITILPDGTWFEGQPPHKSQGEQS